MTCVELDCAGKRLALTRPRVMGVVNVTPDSFSDGGLSLHGPAAAVDHALELCEQGADLIDIGGESTRPGAAPVSVDDELDRVIPVIERLAGRIDVPISIDSSKPDVMRAALDAGAGFINDIAALTAPGALEVAAAYRVPVCLMHMQGQPRTMQRNPRYDDVIAEVGGFLAARVAACEAAGIDRARLLLDPGFGFGKTLAHNLQLLHGLPKLCDFGLPLLVGLSRKSMLGQLTGREIDQRLVASAVAAALAAERGAAILRVHDVAATVDALKLVAALADSPWDQETTK